MEDDAREFKVIKPEPIEEYRMDRFTWQPGDMTPVSDEEMQEIMEETARNARPREGESLEEETARIDKMAEELRAAAMENRVLTGEELMAMVRRYKKK